MARHPDCLAVSCPYCGAVPGQPCKRLRLVADRTVVHESVHAHRARRDALAEQNRRTGTIR